MVLSQDNDNLSKEIQAFLNVKKTVKKIESKKSMIDINPEFLFEENKFNYQNQNNNNKSLNVQKKDSKLNKKNDKLNDPNFFLTAENNVSKINISNIQGKGINDSYDANNFSTSKIINKSKFLKEKCKGYDFDGSVLAKIENSSLSILPKLKDSITSHNRKEISIVENQTKDMIRIYDDLVYKKLLLYSFFFKIFAFVIFFKYIFFFCFFFLICLKFWNCLFIINFFVLNKILTCFF